MRYFSLVVMAAVSSVASTQIASAADMPIKAPVAPAPVAFNWTGWYIGANGGYGWGSSNISATPLPSTSFSFPFRIFIAENHPRSLDPNGAIAGGQVGYNWQVSNWVLGLEADFNYFRLTDSFALTPTAVLLGASGTISTRWLATGRARVGFAIDRWLVYGTGGLAVGRVNYSETIAVAGGATGVNSFSASITENRVGWTIGGGVEWAFAPNWSAKAEYLYLNLGGMSVTALNSSPLAPDRVFAYTADLKANLVRGGINYRFSAR